MVAQTGYPGEVDWNNPRDGAAFCTLPTMYLRVYLKNRNTTDRILELERLTRKYQNSFTK